MRQWLLGVDDYPIVMGENGHEAQWIWKDHGEDHVFCDSKRSASIPFTVA